MSVWGQRSVLVFWGCVLLAVVCCPVVVIVHLYILLGLGWRVFFQIGAGLYAVGRPVQKRNDEDGQIGTIQSLPLERGALFNRFFGEPAHGPPPVAGGASGPIGGCRGKVVSSMTSPLTCGESGNLSLGSFSTWFKPGAYLSVTVYRSVSHRVSCVLVLFSGQACASFGPFLLVLWSALSEVSHCRSRDTVTVENLSYFFMCGVRLLVFDSMFVNDCPFCIKLRFERIVLPCGFVFCECVYMSVGEGNVVDGTVDTRGGGLWICKMYGNIKIYNITTI